MMNRLAKTTVIGLIGALALGFGVPNAFAASYSGSLTSASGLTGGGTYAAGATITWSVNDTTSPGYWTYTYTVIDNNTTQAFLLIEVSSGGSDPFSSGNIGPGTSTVATGYPTVHSTDGVPSAVYCLRFNTSGTVTIVTKRSPVWGDFFAKASSAGTPIIYNAGFTASDTDPANAPAKGSVSNHVLVPDTISDPT